jgi:hypothetical protein
VDFKKSCPRCGREFQLERPKAPPANNLPLLFGLDLGQSQDYSALAGAAEGPARPSRR